jgi:hypothetical protein
MDVAVMSIMPHFGKGFMIPDLRNLVGGSPPELRTHPEALRPPI